MKNRNFAVVGHDIRAAAIETMLPGPGVGPQEGVVEVPREVVVNAVVDLLRAT